MREDGCILYTYASLFKREAFCFVLSNTNFQEVKNIVSIRVQGAPSFYKCNVGVLQELELLLKERDIHSLLVIHGKKSFEAVQDYWPELPDFEVHYTKYAGECSESEISRCKERAVSLEVDAVIGIGGGKALDLAKAVGHVAKKDVILVPTLASTCAAWTPLSVIYDDEGRFVTYTIFPRSPYMVLVEPRVILKAPLSYLKAGIADTLAKWYEARALAHRLDYIPMSVQVALYAAKLSRDRLLEDSHRAIEDCENHRLSPAFLTILESNVLLGGMVGGFGDEYGRIAGAHTIHNALTYIPSTHHLLHGEKVAYGILVQLALEKNIEEINLLLPFFQRIGLPSKLEHLQIINSEQVQVIANRALAPHESIHFMKDTFSQQDIIAAIEKLGTLQN
ncbi:iron-containing alcohol dehydrogenase family protein [Sutcliffiella deserti]|uniref:iron-containing alcohol dehydrogenase family protein n=1 Tax=Sutcliffiella deserti TaxID=2875501 RepID=UPI001CBFFE85|nr:iron-containing alcohol dehydrogenase family protein [Sutcliffiella deserti]